MRFASRLDYRDARYNLANALAAQGEMEEAAANFRAGTFRALRVMLAVREHLVAALTELGGSAISSGRIEEAADYYRELVELEPGNADLRNNFGIVLIRRRRYSGRRSNSSRQR